MIAIEHLNESQRRAVNWDDGPLLVLAGPGSGKTAVLTLRCARLLRESEENNVLALTFTDKAATEMRDRLDKLYGSRTDRARLTTFHAYAKGLLQQHGVHVGLRPDFGLVTLEEDRRAVLEAALADLGDVAASAPADRKAILEFLDRLGNDSFDPDNVHPRYANIPPWSPAVFAAYVERIRQSNQLDYMALIFYARRLLERFPAIVRLERLAWTHVSVDEFQDTNRAQYELLKLVVPASKPNLFVVGDEDQILYQWNGASSLRLTALQEDFKPEVLQLPESYRCPHDVIRLANLLIARNKRRLPNKEPLTSRQIRDAEAVQYSVWPDEAGEAGAVGRSIVERKLVHGHCAVLARSTRQLEGIGRVLDAMGLTIHIPRRKTEFDSPLLRTAYNLTRLANRRHDRDVLRRLCVAWGVMARQIIETDEVAAEAAVEGGDFLRAFLASVEANEEVIELARDHLLDSNDALSFVEAFFSAAENLTEGDEMATEELSTWRGLHDELLNEHGRERLTLHAYVQALDFKSKAPPEPPNAVRLLTVHGAKGREFRHVFVVGLADEVFPSYQAVKKGDDSAQMEEERRSCFVAITRTQESLWLSRAERYSGWSKRPSRFLLEMGFEP